jgi:hypothetical protein
VAAAIRADTPRGSSDATWERIAPLHRRSLLRTRGNYPSVDLARLGERVIRALHHERGDADADFPRDEGIPMVRTISRCYT